MKTIKICIGSACHLKGSYEVIEIFQSEIREHQLENEIELNAAFCLGECAKGVSVKIDDNSIISVSPKDAKEIFENYILRGE
ncbi:MAG TPA: (2Fe-2S) ferredoxin domain-containing protein [Peptostreptococcaceae bacterium]|nr:(2Fe-2S) ferredoxin domain-containing protein [Peptostreptococcaceae bacterium]